MAVKNIPIQSLFEIKSKSDIFETKFDKTIVSFIRSLKELFFILLFSELQIGPQAKTIGGFDMVIYHDSIVFATEICSEFRNNTQVSDIK